MNSDRAGIRLFLLGSPQVIDATSRQISLHGKKPMALLAYIATTAPQIHSREKLATLFWPDLSIKDAHNNLRVSLARNGANLGSSAEPYILADRQSVQLNDKALLWSDVAELRRRHSGLASLPAELTPMLPCAIDSLVACFQGTFLSGLNLKRCAEFEQWVFEMREHFRVMVIKLFDQLADQQQRAGQLSLAEAMTRRVLELDSLHEPAHRRLMMLLAQQDLRHAAMAHFEHVRKLLQVELGISPDSVTFALLAAIEAGNLSALPGCSSAPGSG